MNFWRQSRVIHPCGRAAQRPVDNLGGELRPDRVGCPLIAYFESFHDVILCEPASWAYST
ncbi:MAG: hypothetical protein WD230_03550 [Cucumibacter sp.]